jgi:hypothetical protein
MSTNADPMDTFLYLCELVGYLVILVFTATVLLYLGSFLADISLALGVLYLPIASLAIVYGLYLFQQRVIADGLELGLE